MTAIFHDIKSVLNTPKQKEPIPGLPYAEILYADDTLIFGTHTHSIYIAAAEREHEFRTSL